MKEMTVEVEVEETQEEAEEGRKSKAEIRLSYLKVVQGISLCLSSSGQGMSFQDGHKRGRRAFLLPPADSH